MRGRGEVGVNGRRKGSGNSDWYIANFRKDERRVSQQIIVKWKENRSKVEMQPILE